MSTHESALPCARGAGAVLVAALLCACGGADKRNEVDRPGAGSGAAEETEASPPELRLPRSVLPTGYVATLKLDPAKPTFTGSIEIAAEVAEPTRVFWLNAEELTIDRATLAAGSSEAVELEVIPAEHDFVGFRAPEEIPPGEIEIAVEYAGKIDPTDTMGIFHQKDRGDWYLFTQFEPLAARRAFPCFDEPDNKVPWKLTLEVPEGLVALTNTPAVATEQTGRGTKLVEFARTKPVPSYLISFAVGPFELVDAGESEEGVKLRIVTPRGRAEEAAFAAEVTLPLLELVEEYAGSPYPYKKLDSIAIPATVGFGAMEHAGLITYSARLLLSKPEELTLDDQRYYVAVAVHELAHQWFGNLVTTAWWDDIWLNESFATWLEEPVIAAFRPEWGAGVERVTAKHYAMHADRLASARKIHEPIATNDDVESAFDGITYAKGAAVIRMFEAWVGPKEWQRGLQAYLEQFAWGNATAGEFLTSVSESLGPEVGKSFATFIEQVGAPLVSFELECAEEKKPALSMTQRRYLPIGSEASADVTWRLPVCVEYPAGGGELARDCVLLAGARGKMPLTSAQSCPAWFLPSGAKLGYYRMELPASVQAALLGAGGAAPEVPLDLPARVGLVDNLVAMVAAGKVEPAAALALVPRLARDPSRHVVGGALDIVEGVREQVPEAARSGYARFVRRAFGKRARRLGWKRRKGESVDDRLLRPRLVRLVGVDGEDDRLLRQATARVRAWLADRKSVAPEMVEIALEIAARRGDEALFSALLEAARAEEVMSDRRKMLEALGWFTDQALAERALALVLADEFHIRESSEILDELLEDRRTRGIAYTFVVEHFDALIDKLPRQARAELAEVAGAQCQPEPGEEIAALFPEKIEPLPGGPRALAKELEKRALCLAQKRAFADPLAAFFKSAD